MIKKILFLIFLPFSVLAHEGEDHGEKKRRRTARDRAEKEELGGRAGHVRGQHRYLPTGGKKV